MKLYNDIDENILMKHLQAAYYETLEKKYSQKKYKVYREYEVMPGIRADLFVIKNDDEMIMYEIKTGKMNKEQKNRLFSIKEYVEAHKNVKLKMIFLNYPQTKEIEFESLVDIISNDLWNKGTPHELDVLSTHTRIEEVNDIEIDSLEIKDDGIYLRGSGIIELSLQAGSDREAEDDDMLNDSFPFEFEITLRSDFTIEKSNYKFDTSSYFE